MEKQLKWFRIGEDIPGDAKYLKSERKVVRWEDGGHPMLDDIPIYEEFHLYEVIVGGVEQ